MTWMPLSSWEWSQLTWPRAWMHAEELVTSVTSAST
jgi:hypothetical protein